MTVPTQPTTCQEAELFALRVTDDSMAPEFVADCIIIVDPTGIARDGAFVIAELDGHWILRQLRVDGERVWLRPLNGDYQAVSPPGGLASVKGVVVQRAGKRRRDHKHYA